MSVRIAVDSSSRGGEIFPLWFGHNIEHTRSCMSGGLAAQVLRNRKLAGMPQRSGLPKGWLPIGGGAAAWWLLETPGGHGGADGECYTRHYDPKVGGGVQRLRIGCFRPGARAGIAQHDIPLTAGRAYELRLVMRADREMTVCVRLVGAEPAEWRFVVGPDGWKETSASFTAGRSTRTGRLEIAFKGPGNLIVGSTSLLPTGHFHGMRADVVELLKEIGSPLLRWPGGNFAGDYHWQDGLLPADQRPPLVSHPDTLPHTDGYDDHEVGTDEFIALCRAVGAEPFLTINMSLEGPTEAAAWVEYCNGPVGSKWGAVRAARGHAEPYRVRHWTLGNEMGYAHMKGPNTPEAYTAAARECAAAMRAVDPSIVLTASTSWNKEWYEGVLALNDGYFDNISHHTYDWLIKDFEGPAGASELRRLAALPGRAFRGRGVIDGKQEGRRLTLPDMRAMIEACSPPGRKVGIAFDEWNLWYAWYRTPGMAEGIYAAIMLGEFCRQARNQGMTIGAYFEPINEGAILVDPAGARLTPIGQVMSLFKPHHGRQLLAVDVPAGPDAIDAAASLDEPTGRIALTLVNPSPDQAVTVKVALPAACGPYAAEGTLLSSRDFLPGSTFRTSKLPVRSAPDGTLAVRLPKHSVARIDLTPRA